MSLEHFQGKDGYIWWHGVVEDRKDPLFLGRCRVRILGWHTENKTGKWRRSGSWCIEDSQSVSGNQTSYTAR